MASLKLGRGQRGQLLGTADDDDVSEFMMATNSNLFIYHYQHGGNMLVCQGEDTVADMGRSYAPAFTGPTTGAVGILTKNIAASFRYITVYELGGSLSCSPPGICF